MEVLKFYYENQRFKPFKDDALLERDTDYRYLLPIGTWSLDGPDREILIALPIGDEEGFIAKPNYEGSCGEFWLTYSRKESGKWVLDCKHEDMLDTDCNYDSIITSLGEKKKFYKDNGFLQLCDPEKPNLKYKNSLYTIHKYAHRNSNWFGGIEKYIPHKLTPIIDLEHPSREDYEVSLLDISGGTYRYLCCIDAYHYTSPLTYQLHVFYSVNTDRVLCVCEFT
ncbi:MAG: hypothetical protein MI976_10490 [Pseudomonadales bacterium]|nr:hypothetical protein [Pseudomonadales bacterium]